MFCMRPQIRQYLGYFFEGHFILVVNRRCDKSSQLDHKLH